MVFDVVAASSDKRQEASTIGEGSSKELAMLTVWVLSDSEREFTSLHNQARVAAGLEPYAWYPPLSRIASVRTNQIASGRYPFSHHNEDGSSEYINLLSAIGITSFQWAGENLALTSNPEPQHAFDILMASPEHRSNILDPNDFNVFGCARSFRTDGVSVWATIFFKGAS